MSETMYEVASFTMHDEKHYPDGRVERLPVVHNKIQATIGALLAKLTSGKDATAILRMETGTGDPAWDLAPPPPDPGTAQIALMNPLARSAAFVPASDWVYLQTPPTVPETVSGSATSRVRVTITFAIGASNGTLREAALYGGVAATATLGTGDLVNVLRHVAIAKPSGSADYALVRQVILQF